MTSNVNAQLPLVTALLKCASRPTAAFHAPGHKRGQGASLQFVKLLGDRALRADLPELPELDNLFAPSGVIQQAQELAAQTFGAEQTWFLVNGSTSGVIAGLVAVCNPGEKVILPRNVHQSAISGLVLSGAVPIFVQPEYDPVLDIAHCVTPDAIAQALMDHPDAKAVMILSPTYFGACGNVAAIAQLCHQHSVPLLVDEAHGAHFGFHPKLPPSALSAGADLAVQSTHKVLSAMTQAAMVHVRGDLIDRDRLSKALALVQSTSPNYVLLASLDAARYQMATAGERLMAHTLKLADEARSRLAQISRLSVLSPAQAKTPGFVALDRTRLTVTVSGLGMCGFTADEILAEQWGVVAELPSLRHLTFIISLGNTGADIDRLIEALRSLAREPEERGQEARGERQEGHGQARGRRGDTETLPTQSSVLSPQHSELTLYPSPLTPRDAFFAATETIAVQDSIDRTSAELICPYPPGIPAVIPGEVITEATIAYLLQILAAGGRLSGCADPALQTMRVVKQA